ncbi:phosphoribosylanthranilate isomerase [Clostridium autoethanogenum]|uniref:N-(5'-phosphoribosyl)anthranilate isomerase n=1 Tax=Clostridium autoethanogenum DSM 10061 TaxID=1341692 RepID=A0ABM5NZ94_9CLOT|nr:phosphoribosylanthranilate isomerase [Clostridium autoethanogenum]AGY77908.1 phosphoribosylanthranilate isomerase [Clostridium autoethanogenum DSM 10061]ALU38042.1 N-(5'-phosphoribosyl)anthranilate isomerase [Clostridium autoethanogenum DSM 10061]OVY50806.1 N-(5'-phosphoribosyl)anthranilate isomerase [Clostridium autoethanogenum]
MTLVKICGIRRIEDVEILNKLLPDYAGFVFCESKRQVTLKLAEELIKNLDKKIRPVGVFQNNSLEEVKNTAEMLKLDVIQLHGREDESYIKNLYPFKIWKSVSIDGKDILDNVKHKIDKISNYNVEAVLVDSSVGGKTGGTGINFNWNVLKNLNVNKKLVLAGGLNSDNINTALEVVKPYAVDVSSGVEENGVKSLKKINEFMEKVRNF